MTLTGCVVPRATAVEAWETVVVEVAVEVPTGEEEVAVEVADPEAAADGGGVRAHGGDL